MGHGQTLESRTSKRIIDLIKERGGMAVKYHIGINERIGTPDIIACYKGRMILIETKNEEYQPTKRQIYESTLWLKAGAYHMVARSVDAVAHFLDCIDDD